MRPKIKYAKSGDVNIAYSVMGDGPIDLVMVHGFVSNIGLHHDHPTVARLFNDLASFARVIQFDKRGTGLSDRPGDHATLEDRVQDTLAVMDAVGSKKAAIFGASEGGSMSILFAAMHPERTHCLMTFGAFAKRIKSADYPWAPTPEERNMSLDKFVDLWTNPTLDELAPSVANDPIAIDWITTYFQNSTSPTAVYNIFKTNTDIDVTSILPTIHVPTMIMHRTGDRDANVEEGRWISEQIPGAKFCEMPGDDHIYFFGDTNRLAKEIKLFIQSVTSEDPSGRVLATIVFTDIVGSTDLATKLGDKIWRGLWERFVALANEQTAKQGGRIIKFTGDGFLAIYEGPGKAVESSLRFSQFIKDAGLEIRTGVHTGEIEIMGDDIGGIGVHIASRVMDKASAGEVFVSSTVKDITAGAGLNLEETGEYELKGIEGSWRLFRAIDPSVTHAPIE